MKEIRAIVMNQKLENIYNTAFDLIELRLNKKEQVVPFTICVEKSTDEHLISMYEQNAGNTAECIDEIHNQIKSKIGDRSILASCLCYDVKVTDPRTNEKVDAIVFELDSPDESIDIHVPYNFNSQEIIQVPFQQSSTRNYFT